MSVPFINAQAAKGAVVRQPDGSTVPLRDYPEAQLEFFDFCGYSPKECVDQLEEMDDTPETAIDVFAREYSNAVVIRQGRGNDRILRNRFLGHAEETIWAGGTSQGGDYYFRVKGCDDAFDARTDWLCEESTGQYIISWRRHDTGDGIMLGDYAYFVAFMEEDDDVAFLAAFPGAGA